MRVNKLNLYFENNPKNKLTVYKDKPCVKNRVKRIIEVNF